MDIFFYVYIFGFFLGVALFWVIISVLGIRRENARLRKENQNLEKDNLQFARNNQALRELL